MNIVFRVDASTKIGSGHLVRCLTLAEELRNHGVAAWFICRDHSGNLIDRLQQREFRVEVMPMPDNQVEITASDNYLDWLAVPLLDDASQTIAICKGERVDCLIVDHYAINQVWEHRVRRHVGRIMVIDDLANRSHDCDILLDQTYGRQNDDYLPLVPGSCRLLLGSAFALLRPDFKKLRALSIKRRAKYHGIFRILVSMGSVDELDLTPLVLQALSQVEFEYHPVVDVVLASGAPHLKALHDRLDGYSIPVNLLVDVTNMGELMLNADLAIGSGGTTSWERCCMALPSILVTIAENQVEIGKNLASAGATLTLPLNADLSHNIIYGIDKFQKDKPFYMSMSKRASEICDGAGVSTVVNELLA